ncbi:hypothetical protein [Streptomyces sp. DH37]|uniref:hypothetical protein n=1 Tax=Streptomyces sp. DH37 TaxID=3040122 RepID=UPI0024420E7A|nr:hypothetical protein [Streptomyces sp. DH37]MDG9701683.1 hypothetical protein [Streptomyces sp. DH37]
MAYLGLIVGLARLRLALMVAGLAWFVDLDASPAARWAIGGLLLVALLLEWALDPPPLREPAAPRDRHHTTT